MQRLRITLPAKFEIDIPDGIDIYKVSNDQIVRLLWATLTLIKNDQLDDSTIWFTDPGDYLEIQNAGYHSIEWDHNEDDLLSHITVLKKAGT
jgi:hypothetical protein